MAGYSLFVLKVPLNTNKTESLVTRPVTDCSPAQSLVQFIPGYAATLPGFWSRGHIDT